MPHCFRPSRVLLAAAALLAVTCGPGTVRTRTFGRAGRRVRPPAQCGPALGLLDLDGRQPEPRGDHRRPRVDERARASATSSSCEVNVGVPRGPVEFMSPEWRELFAHAVREAERLGIRDHAQRRTGLGRQRRTVGQAGAVDAAPRRQPRSTSKARRGSTPSLPAAPAAAASSATGALPQEMQAAMDALLRGRRRAGLPHAAREARSPTSTRRRSTTGRPIPPSRASSRSCRRRRTIPGLARRRGRSIRERIVDLHGPARAGRPADWDVPAGRLDDPPLRPDEQRRQHPAGARRPASASSATSSTPRAFDAHFDAYSSGTLAARNRSARKPAAGRLDHAPHRQLGDGRPELDRRDFREEFRKRRGYDPLPYLPAFTGRIVGSLEIVRAVPVGRAADRRTSWIIENHAGRFKELGRRHGFELSIEPYDMNPAADLDLGGVADVPMGEFWSDGFRLQLGLQLHRGDVHRPHARPADRRRPRRSPPTAAKRGSCIPAALKNQGDWAFCAGINRFVYHTVRPQAVLDRSARA